MKDGESMPVEPKVFRVLIFLLQNSNRLVTKQEIIDVVWKDTSVSDNSLTKSIATLRRMLDDDPQAPTYIATVQTLGYRLVCDVMITDNSDRTAAPVETLQG